jgi:hypothetical protein
MALTLARLHRSLAAIPALALLLTLSAGTGAASAGEDPSKETARKLVERYKDAVVLVEAVVKMKAAGAGGQSQEREQKMEANGTVITPEGLVVVSNASIDPTRALGRMGVKVDISTSDVKIVTADGTEHVAELVLTDKDLDLAFVRPKNPIKLPCVELKKSADPALLDALVSVTRLGRKANREPGAGLGEVLAIIHKPRLRFVPSGQVFQGCPVFNAAGEVLGPALAQTDGAVGMSILPCEDILEAAKQVGQKQPEAKPEAKDPATDKKPAEKPAADPTKGAL